MWYTKDDPIWLSWFFWLWSFRCASPQSQVIRFNANCLKKSGQRVKNSVPKVRTVLAWTLGCTVFNVPSGTVSRDLSSAFGFYWHSQGHPCRDTWVLAYPYRTTPFFWSWLIMEILDEKIPPRQDRSNPRLVKKTRSKFPSKKPIHRGTGTQR